LETEVLVLFALFFRLLHQCDLSASRTGACEALIVNTLSPGIVSLPLQLLMQSIMGDAMTELM
jgi:hypothetical protein